MPYGYLRDPAGELVVDSAAASIVRRIFAERAAGRTLSEIATDLACDRVPTARGAGWRAGTVHGILSNPAYTGRPAWNKRGAPILAEQSTWPAIVSEATFCRGQPTTA